MKGMIFMTLLKKALAVTAAITLPLSMAACGNSSSSSSSSSHVDQVSIQDTSKVDSLDDGTLSEADRTIKWMGTFDLNQADGNETRVDTQLFNDKGGIIDWIRVTDSSKFEKLAAAISANDPPDIFKYEWMAFPCQTLINMYQPVDSIVDFDSDLWSDVKSGADKFVLNGEHYVAPISYSTGVLMMYDQDIVDTEGITDPYTLWMEGEWNWNTFREVMEEYVANGDGETPRYGITGWYAPQIIQQTGKTMITYDGKHFESNIMDPDIERAESFIYDLKKDGLVYNEQWVNDASSALASMGNVMFFSMGPWALTGNYGPHDDQHWSVVPIPADPNTGAKITTSDMTAFMWVAGSTKDKAVKTWLECAHIAATDEQYKEDSKAKFMIDNPGWTDEMYDVLMVTSSSEYDQVFDYGYGISSSFSDDNSVTDGSGCTIRQLYENVIKTDDTGKQYTWSEVRSTYSKTTDDELAKVNAAIDAMEG